MKYLKQFELFNSGGSDFSEIYIEVTNYIKDILIELKDVGVSYTIKTYDKSLFIRMTRDPNIYRWREVEPFIEHLISYLSTHGFRLNEEDSTKDLLKSRDNRPFNYLEVRFDMEEEKKNWKNFFKRKKYTTLDLRNGNVYVKYSGQDMDKMKSVLIDAFGSSFVTNGNMIKDRVYYAKSKHNWETTTKTSGLDKPIVSEKDITLSNKSLYESIDYSMIDTINDICLELSDLGFYSDRDGRNFDNVFIQPAHGIFETKSSYVGISNGSTFYFDEIKEYIYHMVDIVGIENVGTFNYRYLVGDSYTRCDMSKLENESLDIKGELKGAFITFNFPVIEEKLNQ